MEETNWREALAELENDEIPDPETAETAAKAEDIELTGEPDDPDPAPLPCNDCGTPSAKSPCPRCGRYKW